MLAGQELGQALERAMEMKGIGPSALARQFQVTPSSVGDWRKRGCIHKRHLGRLVEYFADVVPPSHWGLKQPESQAASPPVVGARMMSRGIFAVEGDWRRIEEKSEALKRQLASVDAARFSPMAIELVREFDAIRDDQRQMEAFVKCMALIAKAQV